LRLKNELGTRLIWFDEAVISSNLVKKNQMVKSCRTKLKSLTEVDVSHYTLNPRRCQLLVIQTDYLQTH
jgi:hypothetical protein